jgi:hypothetical protein
MDGIEKEIAGEVDNDRGLQGEQERLADLPVCGVGRLHANIGAGKL